MQNITRRTMLAAVPVVGLTSVVPAMAEPVDPLVGVIREYYAQLADFNANAPQGCNDAFNAYADATFNPPMHQIEEWDQPARSIEGVREAIRLALKESEEFSASDMIPPLLRAALAYLDVEAA